MKAIIALGLFISLIAACQTLDESASTEEISSDMSSEQLAVGEGDVEALLGTCRTTCGYGECGPCLLAGGETTCYIFNGCGGKYPTP